MLYITTLFSSEITFLIQDSSFSDNQFKEEQHVFVESFFARTDNHYSKDELKKSFSRRIEALKPYQSNTRIIRALHDGVLIGLMLAIFRNKHSAYIHLLSILPTEQGKGIGRKLLEEFIAHWKIQKIELSVQNSNIGAEKFYRKFGFTDLGYTIFLRGALAVEGFTGLVWNAPTEKSHDLIASTTTEYTDELWQASSFPTLLIQAVITERKNDDPF